MYDSFKEALKYLRKKNGVTQTELGEYLGVVQSAVGNWERGRNIPSYELLVKKVIKILGQIKLHNCYTSVVQVIKISIFSSELSDFSKNVPFQDQYSNILDFRRNWRTKIVPKIPIFANRSFADIIA